MHRKRVYLVADEVNCSLKLHNVCCINISCSVSRREVFWKINVEFKKKKQHPPLSPNTCTHLESFATTNCLHLLRCCWKMADFRQDRERKCYYYLNCAAKELRGRCAAQSTLLAMTVWAFCSCTYSMLQIGPSLFITYRFLQSFTPSLPRHANVQRGYCHVN